MTLIDCTLDGRYRIEEEIGSGAFARVYRGLDLARTEKVAVKVLRQDLCNQERVVRRFRQEIELCRRLSSPHTVHTRAHGRTPDGRLYLVLELIEGRTLRAVLDTEGRLPAKRSLLIARQIAESVGEGHRDPQQIVHRDLKPENVFVCSGRDGSDEVKVGDFGLAKLLSPETPEKLTKTGETPGTPLYMAPEQGMGDPISPRTDIYALGVMLYEMLTGSPPFVDVSLLAIVVMHACESPEPMDARCPEAAVPEDVEALVLELLAKLPASRPASIGDVIRRIDALLEDMPQ